MNWASWHEFWAMGGDGLYVWSAYLVAAAVIVTEIIVLAISRRSILEHLGRYARMRARQRKGGTSPATEPGSGASDLDTAGRDHHESTR